MRYNVFIQVCKTPLSCLKPTTNPKSNNPNVYYKYFQQILSPANTAVQVSFW